jgi:hypothetical protein
MRYELPPDIRNVSDEEILEDMKRVGRGHRKSHLSYHLYGRFGKFGTRTILRRWGTWNEALVEAGLDVGKRYGIPEEEFFLQMEKMWKTLGRPPIRSDWDRVPTTISNSSYAVRFGSWRNALEMFVVWANGRGKKKRGAKAGEVKIGPRVVGKRRGAREPSYRLRYEVLQRDGFRCVVCGRSPGKEAGVMLHVDHIRPWSAGGETVKENLQTLCERCNLGKGALVAR